MSEGLNISAAWEKLDEGTPEEKASFGLLEIRANDILMSEGQDAFVNRLRNGPFVSNYYCAEWLAWNWWRLRWEPRSAAGDWAFAHKMSSIGQGYTWPNVTIASDGERVALISKPSSERQATSFRYITDKLVVVTADAFEGAIDAYIEQVVSQLQAEGVGRTNLSQIWAELGGERQEPRLSERRRLEALMGSDPGEGNEENLDGLVEDSNYFGGEAALEMAAFSAIKGELRRASDLRDVAAAQGFSANLDDAVRLSTVIDMPASGMVPAWRRGSVAAIALRRQECLGLGPIADRALEQMTGLVSGALEARDRRYQDLSFALDTGQATQVVFRSKWQEGRRFELARLIGDRVTTNGIDKLYLATSAYTYRQKLQRSFAAEFLCPFAALTDFMQGADSADAIDDAAHHFRVSERTVRTLLVNHGILQRDMIEGEVEGSMAA